MDESQLETAASNVPVPQALDRWGPFERMQRVGRGAFGEVYRAFDPTLQRYVALKLLLPRGVDRESESRALVAEARAMARIKHPNVVSIFGVDEHDGHAAHAGGPRRTLLDVRPDLPLALAQVTEKAAHPDPSKRFASTGQLAAALSAAMGMGTAAAAALTRIRVRSKGLRASAHRRSISMHPCWSTESSGTRSARTAPRSWNALPNAATGTPPRRCGRVRHLRHQPEPRAPRARTTSPGAQPRHRGRAALRERRRPCYGRFAGAAVLMPRRFSIGSMAGSWPRNSR